tara:strand:+ start:1638 stop:3005 length:1368 start_codon:yes stop_codon:yes gene_type:complete
MNKNLSNIPSVSQIMQLVENKGYHNNRYLKFIIKEELENIRKIAVKGKLSPNRNQIINEIVSKITILSQSSIRPVINATGIVLHTGLGRAPQSKKIINSVAKKLYGYVNLEFNLDTGKRGQRQSHVANIISSITGAEDAIIVNNNAAAVLLSLNELAEGKEVIVSRGQLVEIGGSFRIPDMIAKSGCSLVEVGTTNRTHISDYENAINKNTGAILWVHTSNYTISGFTKEVQIEELVALGKKKRISVMTDLGCGEVLNLSQQGIPTNIIVEDVVKKGSSITTFSGDKLLGGPQSGIIIGKKSLIKKIKTNPIARTVRCDKWTISLLEETLRSTQKESIKDNLTLSLLMSSRKKIQMRAEKVFRSISPKILKNYKISIEETLVEAGSGTLPSVKFESVAFRIASNKYSASKLSERFRNATHPVVGFIKNDNFHLDFKSIIPFQEKFLMLTITEVLD